MMWSYILTVVGLSGFWLAGKKVWWAWYINVAAQALWATYAVVTTQYGFLVGAAVYTVVFSRNAYKWTTEHFSIKPLRVVERNSGPYQPMKKLRGPYGCYWCDAAQNEWCKDDCGLLDPWDYR